MNPEQIAEKQAETASAEAKAKDDKEAADRAKESSQRKERTRLEKLRHTRASIDAQIAQEEVANGGIVISTEDDDDKPLTKGDLKRMQREDAKKTALQMANDLEDEDERSQVTELLETRILPSGNPQKDLQLALSAVRSEKNAQIASEATRKRNVTTSRSSGTGAPSREEDHFEATETELTAAAMVGKKSPADIKAFILKARAKEQK